MANKHTHRQYLASIILWMIFTAVWASAMIYYNDGVFFAPTLIRSVLSAPRRPPAASVTTPTAASVC